MSRFFTRKNILILLGVLLVIVAVYLLVRKTPLPEGLVQVNGRIEGDTVVISSKYNGRIAQLLVREGDKVKRGQVVVRLDDPETRSRLAQAEHDLQSVIAQAKAAGQDIGLTQETGGSVIEQARGQVSQGESDIQTAQAEAGTAAANVKQAQSAVIASQASLRQAQEDIKRLTADVETSKSTFQAAQKAVDAARSQAKLSESNARRFTNLAREGVVTERQRDEYVTAAAKDQADLAKAEENANSAKSQILAKQSELARAKDTIESAKANLESARSQVAASRQEVMAARSRVSTARGKKAQATGSLREALTSPTQVAISTSRHASTLAQINQAKAKVAEQRSILASLFVVSPITGTIINRIRDMGEIVTAGSPILEAVDLDKLYLKAYVPENQIGKVRLGLPAKIYVDAYPDQPFDGVIRYISSSAEFTPKEVQTPDERVKLVYAVKIYLTKNPNQRLTPGMPADAIIRWKENVPWQRPQY